jgi:ferredoxin
MSGEDLMPRLTIVVDRDLCELNAVCTRQAPEVFDVDDETDQLRLLVEHPDSALRDRVEAAVEMCPRAALRIVEE